MRTFRIPITWVAVVGVAGLVALAVGIVLYLGLYSATSNTRSLMTDQAEGLIRSMERGLELRLQPVIEQAEWIAAHLAGNSETLPELDEFDEFLLGALAGTPQVAGIAIVTPDGVSRRWTRATGEVVTEDWSGLAEIVAWLENGSQRKQATWNDPFFTETIGQSVLLHDFPLRDSKGRFLGMLGQIVPLTDLSRHIADLSRRAGMTPFILYGKDRVLAHPLLINERGDQSDTELPLRKLSELDDPVLQRIWSPDERDLFFLQDIRQLTAAGAFIREQRRFFVYLYRNVADYGQSPWTVGAYLDTEIYGGVESQRMVVAFFAGLATLLLASVLAVLLGRRITRPVSAIANAARLVESDRLAEVPELPPSRVRELDDAARSFNQMVVDLRERALIRQTLGRYVPEEVARTLLSEGGSIEPVTAEATLLYSDIENFTGLTEALGPTKIVEVLNAYFSSMVEILERHHGVVTQFHGDAILATFNVPIRNPRHTQSAISAGSEMLSLLATESFAGHRLGVRIGINTGPVVAGAVGASDRLSYTVYGDSVNLAARLEALNKEFDTRILISEYSAGFAGDCTLRSVGETQIRGRSESIKAFTLSANPALSGQAV